MSSRLILGKGNESRGFHSFSWKNTNLSSELTRSESFWRVRSTFSKSKTVRFLRLKFFWGELSPEEQQLAFDSPGFLNDVEFNVMLALLAEQQTTREKIQQRVEKALRLIGKKSHFRKELIRQWENNIFLTAKESKRPIRPHKAYSGWVRNSSSVGSKRKSKFFIPDPISEDFDDATFDEYEFLYKLASVGKLDTNLGVLRLP